MKKRIEKMRKEVIAFATGADQHDLLLVYNAIALRESEKLDKWILQKRIQPVKTSQDHADVLDAFVKCVAKSYVDAHLTDPTKCEEQHALTVGTFDIWLQMLTQHGPPNESDWVTYMRIAQRIVSILMDQEEQASDIEDLLDVTQEDVDRMTGRYAL